MKALFYILFFSLTTSVITSCNNGKQTVAKVDISEGKDSVELAAIDNPFVGCWKDSREENKSNSLLKIFRHCDFKEFPASRFRFTMQLNLDSSCQWLYLAPNDRHEMKPGTWKYIGETKKLSIYNSENNIVKSFLIESVDEDKLNIKK